MLKLIRKFRDLSSNEKRLFIEAWLTLGFMRGAILTIPFKRLTRSLEQHQNDAELTPLSREKSHLAITTGKIISQAANNTPWQSSCLVQSFTAQRMLEKRNIPGVFYLGVRKDETAEEKMSAHAWSRCGDMIITGDKGREDFTVISTFRWGQ